MWRLYSTEPRTSATGLAAATARRPASAKAASFGLAPASEASAATAWVVFGPPPGGAASAGGAGEPPARAGGEHHGAPVAGRVGVREGAADAAQVPHERIG